MASKIETKKGNPFRESKKPAHKKRARGDEDAHDLHSLNDKTKRSKQAHKTALDTSKPDVEGTKKDVSEAISPTPVVNQQAGEPAVNPEKKKKNKNKKKSQKSKKTEYDAPVEQRMSDMTSFMNKTSKQPNGKDHANHTKSDELPVVKQVKPKYYTPRFLKKYRTNGNTATRGLPEATRNQIEAAVAKAAAPVSRLISTLPVAAVTQFMNDLEDVFMQFKMRYASELASAAVVDGKVVSLVAAKGYTEDQEKLPAKLIKKESVDFTKGSDADSSSDESSDDDKLDDSHSSNTLVDSY